MMVSKEKPYVCVSGVSSAKEASEVVSLFKYYGFYMHSDCIPSLGIQSSYKSLQYGYSEGNRRIPHLNKMPAILSAVKGDVFSVLHYFTKNPDRLFSEVSKLLATGNMYENGLVNGMQLNGIWPSVTGSIEAQKIKSSYPKLKIILQLKPQGSQQISESDAAALINAYSGVDYVLLDSSGGLGYELKIGETANAYEFLRSNGFENGIGVAGGLTGENVYETLTRLIRMLPDSQLSIDAEGGLRDKLGEGYGNDVLSMEKVGKYIKEAASALLR